MKALVVDRSATTRRIALRALRAAGIPEALECASLEDAATALAEPLDLAIVEWVDDDALRVLSELAAREGEKPRIIVMSERDRREDVERVTALGIMGYVLKPVEARVLVGRIVAAIQAPDDAAETAQDAAA